MSKNSSKILLKDIKVSTGFWQSKHGFNKLPKGNKAWEFIIGNEIHFVTDTYKNSRLWAKYYAQANGIKTIWLME